MKKAWEIVADYQRAVEQQATVHTALMESGKAMFDLVTKHGPLRYCDTVYMIENGVLQEETAPKDVYCLDDSPKGEPPCPK